ncbi:MAG: hypothetical protein JXR76_31410 [Deltaproteobacteria bacterium]|nr:hypothetical protein [Deltaproteobacteria bacterium]
MTNKPRFLIAAGTMITTFFFMGFAAAQSQDEWRQATENTAPRLQLNQSYAGTKPGEGNKLPQVTELKEKKGLWITWPGFMMTDDGGSRVFLQTTGPLKYKTKTQKKKIVLTFKKTRIHLSNNRNPLVTSHFNTPVSRINLKRRGKNSELILNLKTESTPNISQMTDADGYNYLFVDFPQGQYPIQNEQPGNRPSFSSNGHPNMTNYDAEQPAQEE